MKKEFKMPDGKWTSDAKKMIKEETKKGDSN